MNFLHIIVALFLIMAFIFIFPIITGLLNPFIAIGQSQDSGSLFKWVLTILPVGLFMGGIAMILLRGR